MLNRKIIVDILFVFLFVAGNMPSSMQCVFFISFAHVLKVCLMVDAMFHILELVLTAEDGIFFFFLWLFVFPVL